MGNYDAVNDDSHLQILIPKACKNIPKIRHEAIYRNEAWDRAAEYASRFLEMKELPLKPLKYKIYHVKELNVSLLKWQTEIISSLIEKIKKHFKNGEVFSLGYEKCVNLVELFEMSSKHIIEEEKRLNKINPKIKDIALEIFKVKTEKAKTQ